MMKVLAIATLALAGTAYAVSAQSDAIGQRQAAMKRFGALSKEAGDMAKGEKPYNQARVDAIMQEFSGGIDRFAKLFPANSKGGKSTASDAVWDNAAGFRAAIAKFNGDLSDASYTAKSAATLGQAMRQIGGNCGSCHGAYRVKK